MRRAALLTAAVLIVPVLYGANTTQPASGPTTRSAPSIASADAPATAPAGAGVYVDPSSGFSIAAPKFARDEQDGGVPVVFNGPPKNAFAPNVNVLIDPVHTTRKEYVDSALVALKQGDTKFNSTRELMVGGREGEILDYEATRNGRKVRFLQLVVVMDERVYIVTCTDLADDFAQVQSEFQKCLDSFRPPAK